MVRGRDPKQGADRPEFPATASPRFAEQEQHSRLVSPMRELERELIPQPTPDAPVVLIGRGSVGESLTAAAEAAGLPARLAQSADAAEAARGATAAILCVPDDAVFSVCEAVAQADPLPRLVGHPSGAGTLASLEPAFAAGAATFSLHPLQTFPDGATPVEGTPAAIAGSDEEAAAFARGLAARLGMRPFDVPEEQRAAYHAAACMASNFLVALQEASAELLSRAGIEDARELLAPLVLRTAANWAERGPEALTGPIARGDRDTVERHRAALADLAPDMLAAYDALAAHTESVAKQKGAA
jgi:predicted short-subunit dehydrogenase-like oxidoreductase (DUF2520 family)